MTKIESYVVLLYVLLNNRSVMKFIVTVCHNTVRTDNEFNNLYDLWWADFTF